MKYKNIFLNDFGIFNNSKIENINPSFNIIGGVNRAGKTTFLKALRYIGFGIPNLKTIPPARSSYNIEAILNNSEGNYNLLINGYAKPKIDKINSENTNIENIFGDIDQFTYNQLFTITLKELKKIPDGVSDKDKLMSILMGAGLKEYTLIPKLREDYLSKASDIGGKYGKINVGMFKTYNQTINEGLKEKQEAKLQVEEYYNYKNVLKETQDRIEKLEYKKQELNKEKIKLDLLNSNYDKINELKTIKSEVKKDKYEIVKENQYNFYPDLAKDIYSKYKDLNEEIKKYKDELKGITNLNYNKELENNVIKHEKLIDQYYNQISGLKEKKKNIDEKNNNIINKFNSIKKQAKNISNNLSDNLDLLLEVKVEMNFKNKLRQQVKKYNEINNDIKNIKEDINELETKIEIKNEILSEQEKKLNTNNSSKYYLLTIIILSGLITYLSFIDVRFAGIYIFDLLLIYFYYTKKKANDNILIKYKNNKSELEEINSKINILEKKLKEKNIKKDDINSNLNKIRDDLHLNENISPDLLKDYYEDITSLKSNYSEYLESLNDYKQKREILINELTDISNDLSKIVDDLFIDIKNNNLDDTIDLLVKNIKHINDIKNLTKKINNKTNNLKELENDILNLEGMNLVETREKNINEILVDYLNLTELNNIFIKKTERINTIHDQLTNLTEQMKIAFKIDENIKDEEIINELITYFDKFVSKNQLQEKYMNTKNELDDINQNIENEKKKRQEIKLKMDNMASEEKIIKAEQKINNTRSNMRPLAEKYAKNKMSAYILNKFWEKFLKEKKDNLLKKASNIMSDITNGEYSRIEPKENLTSLEFQIYNNKGEVIDEINNLSRGTIEQLYMAIRINRIMDIEPALPVIIDDSLVNFDSYHLRNIFDIINKLKNRNQIFFLTCHPEQIEYIAERIDDKNYYLLDKGRFSQVSKTKLISNLK